MPNLLKSLPREILGKEDSKFIYNILNPLLFEKVKETNEDIRKEYTVSELMEKDIKIPGQFNNNYIFPFNINSREFHAYLNNGQEKIKLERYSNADLVNQLDDLKRYIFFYFNIDNNNFIQPIIRKFYFLKDKQESYKKLYEENLIKYNETFDIKQKKIIKQTYERFKDLYDKYFDLYQEFELIFSQLRNSNDYSIQQIIDNCASVLGEHLKIKTFDNEIVFSQSKIYEYLTQEIDIPGTVQKHIFSGNTIISSTNFDVENIIHLMAIFAVELSTIKEKYDEYLMLLINNKSYGYSLEKSKFKKIKNAVFENIKVNLESDNLTYFLNEEKNELEIYLYFEQLFRIDETSLRIEINDQIIKPSIISKNGVIHDGYTIFNYMDNNTKYYKITIHNYLDKDLNNNYINYDINKIELTFNAVKSMIQKVKTGKSPIIETTSFLDNFVIYKKNDAGFYEELKIPFKIKVDIEEKEERYIRIFEFIGINDEAHQELISSEDLVISCYAFDYVYEPKLYIDFFKHMNDTVSFRFNTILPYVLIDDVMQEDFELKYYDEIDILDFNTNIHKNVLMKDGKVYKKLFDEVQYMNLLNPYNEINLDFIEKLSYKQYLERNHVRDEIIKDMVKKIPFYHNLKYLEPFQFDKERNCLIIVKYNKQFIIPLEEGLNRGLNYEQIKYNEITEKIEYFGKEYCENDIIYANKKLYIKNPITYNYDLIEAKTAENINLTTERNVIFFDMFEMKHTIIIENKQYNIKNLFIATNEQAIKYSKPILYIESKYGIPRYISSNNEIIDIDFSLPIVLDNNSYDGSFTFKKEDKQLVFRLNEAESYVLELEEISKKKNFHRQNGMTIFSIFYAGNALPENSNKTFFGRENIFNSMKIPDAIYKLGRNEDVINDTQHHKLLGEQLDLDILKAEKYNMEQEPYLMFKTSTSSLKGLESYLRSNLKSISQDIDISPVYLVQRNRFISEWARVSSVLPNSIYAADTLKELVADLMETKLINKNYDDLIDIFKSNEYEKFSLKTNNIHDILIQYIIRDLEEQSLLEELNSYLQYKVWLENNIKKIMDFIKEHANEKTIKEISSFTLNSEFEKERLFYIFISELEKINKKTIETYKPIGNYSDWNDIQENNNVHFNKPFKYDIIDISDFITMPVDWKLPILLIRPLVDDGLFIKKDYRFIDLSIATNSQITYNDAYNEYIENKKAKLNKTVDYLNETLKVLLNLSFEEKFDFLSVNLVIVKWIVERFLPNYILSHNVETVEEINKIIKNELMSAEHPNLIISYNKIKEHILLKDLGSNVNEIYETIIDGEYLNNSYINLKITDPEDLTYLDKIKKPIEHYFDFLFYIKRYDIITKILALFTEDVIASSILDLSIAINIKNSKGDKTYDLYEKMVKDIFDEFLPFHSILDRIIFTIKIMESSSSEAISKEMEVAVEDKSVIDIFIDFIEKVKIQTLDKSIISTSVDLIFPSESFNIYRAIDDENLELPYGFDRSFKSGGYGLVPMDTETYGMDDRYYIEDRSLRPQRTKSIYTPPEFAESAILSNSDFEKIVDTYITDYLEIKETMSSKINSIESHFIDYIPTIDIEQKINDNIDIDTIENYLISINTLFNIKFYDVYNLPMDKYGQDIISGPENQTTLIGMKEAFYQNIMFDFYDKLNISLLDSIWTNIRVIYDFSNIPGHDEFGIDEYYHQQEPNKLGQDISVMIYDELLEQGFNITARDMTDISLVDKTLSTQVKIDIRDNNIVTNLIDTIHTEINIWAGRKKPSPITVEKTTIPGLDEFGYDEFYHNSADLDRIANMIDTLIFDNLDTVRIDFGFMRMLPIDPYQDLIDQKFYRADQPGSDLFKSRVRDKFTMNIKTFKKDYIKVNLLDFYAISIINENKRKEIYNQIENESLSGDYFVSVINESIIKREIHHDFRENIVALEKYAGILDDATIIEIFGTRAADIERDKLFEIRIGDFHMTDIKIKFPVDKVMTKFDEDYLKSIKIEDENFTEFKYNEKDLNVRFSENLLSYYKFNERASINLQEKSKINLNQRNEKEETKLTVFDKLHYGDQEVFKIDSLNIQMNDKLIEWLSNKIYNDSLVISLTENELTSKIGFEYEFKEERTIQKHNEYGQMGYTEESIERSIESRLNDSLLTLSKELFYESNYINMYDEIMSDVREYKKDYVSVVISDSLNTYIDIVKKPWIWPDFDDFGHNTLPHMYHGESEEFDLSTQLRDKLKIDATNWLYNSGALIRLFDNIVFGEKIKSDSDSISVSMTDDLKVISLGFTDKIDIKPSDITHIKRKFKEKATNVIIQDNVWYGFKLRDESQIIKTHDTVNYGFTDYNKRDITINAKLTDWLLKSYIFQEHRYIDFFDSLEGIDTYQSNKDILSVAIVDRVIVDEFSKTHFKDTDADIQITDKLFINTELNKLYGMVIADKSSINFDEQLQYGEGKFFNEKVRGYIQNRLIIDENTEKGPDLLINLSDTFKDGIKYNIFKDSLGIQTYERLKYGLIFKDDLNVDLIKDDQLLIKRSWVINKYGVDEILHDTVGMDYSDDISINNSVTTEFSEKISIISDLIIKDRLDIIPQDGLTTYDNNGTNFYLKNKKDGIIINSVDNLMYSVGYYDYIWDAKEWERYGYEVPYENWTGLLPHNELEHNEFEHNETGNDLSQITTGVYDNLFYGFNYLFKESLNIEVNEKDIFQNWSDIKHSTFTESLSAWAIDSINIIFTKIYDKDIQTKIRKEQIKISYEFDDKIKTHKVSSNSNIATEIIEITDNETYQLIEQIYKYRIYEQLNNEINENLLKTALFKFNDEISLVSDYKTKIKLYKEQSDGSLTQSMTIIKDKTVSNINLFFGDFTNINMFDSIQGTYAESPNEYYE